MKLGKNDLSKIILIIILLLLFIGLAFFRKNENAPKPPENNPQADQLADSGKNKELTEEEKVKMFAKNFVEIYGTYSLGDFSNLESLKDMMSDRLRQEKTEWIYSEKQKLTNKPKVFVSLTTIAKAVKMNFFNGSRAEIEIEYEKTKARGVSIYIDNILTPVNEFGEKTTDPIPKETEMGLINMKLVKENNEWKIEEIDYK